MKSIHKKSLLRRENWMEGFHEGVSLGQEIWMKCIQDKSLSLGRKLDEMHPNRSLSWKRKLNERLPRRTLSRENWMKCIFEVVSLLLLQQRLLWLLRLRKEFCISREGVACERSP
jgi:hypothetical protein